MSGHLVVMILSNPFRPDLRVQREARGLLEAGYRVTLVCWDRESEFRPSERVGGLEIIRVQGVRSGYDQGLRQTLTFPRFLRKAIRVAEPLRPAAVHCHDLDTLYAGCVLKRRLNCPLIYDAHENYPALKSRSLPGWMVRMLGAAERNWVRRADRVFAASTEVQNKMSTFGVESPIWLANFPETEEFTPPEPVCTRQLRHELGVPDETVLVAYIGSFSRNRALVPLIEAAALLPQAEFHLWGDGIRRPQVEELVSKQANAHFHGWLPAERLSGHFHAADIIYYGLDIKDPSSKYNAPNTLAQAMACGKPLIATEIGDLGRIVRATDCGILIDEATPVKIAQAVRALASPEFRAAMGARGLEAHRAHCNARTTRKIVVDCYRELLGGDDN